MKLEGQKIVITGASRGIGLVLAQQFAKKKSHLHLVARKFEAALVEELKKLGAPSVRLWPVDLSSSKEIDKWVSALNTEKIEIDILVNNAGQLTGGLIEEQDPDEIEQMFAVNIGALVRLTRLLLPGMLARKHGLIVNNASVSGKMFLPCASTYAASKAAVVAFTESIKQELVGTGVSTLLLMTPGIKTEMFDDIQKLYGGHLDVSSLDSISCEEWTSRIVKAIEGREDTLWPQGQTRVGVWIGHHMPKLLESAARRKFKR